MYRNRPFHKTLPSSSIFVNGISVKFYETGCSCGYLFHEIPVVNVFKVVFTIHDILSFITALKKREKRVITVIMLPFVKRIPYPKTLPKKRNCVRLFKTR